MALDTPGHTLLNATKMVSGERRRRRRRKRLELHEVGLENIEDVSSGSWTADLRSDSLSLSLSRSLSLSSAGVALLSSWIPTDDRHQPADGVVVCVAAVRHEWCRVVARFEPRPAESRPTTCREETMFVVVKTTTQPPLRNRLFLSQGAGSDVLIWKVYRLGVCRHVHLRSPGC